MRIFLDDFRQPQGAYNHTLDLIYLEDGWHIVINYDEFVGTITAYYNMHSILPELISFDHDLADIHYDPSTWTEGFIYLEKTGLDCAKWLVDFCMDNNVKLPEFLCHSQNPVGKENILKFLNSYKKHETVN